MEEWTKLIDPKQAATPRDAVGSDDGPAQPPASPRPLPLLDAGTRPNHSPSVAQEAETRRGGFPVWLATLRRHALLLAALVLLLWIVEIIDWVLPGAGLDLYGIQPRSANGLRNIAFAPFLHIGFGHLVANTLPLVVLGTLVLLSGLRTFVVVSVVSALSSGVGIWLLGGSNTIHLGASGVRFGFLGFLLAAAWYRRNATSVAIAIAATLLYGGMLWGILPGEEGISWLGHLFGLVGGLAAAFLLHGKPAAQPTGVRVA